MKCVKLASCQVIFSVELFYFQNNSKFISSTIELENMILWKRTNSQLNQLVTKLKLWEIQIYVYNSYSIFKFQLF